MGDGAEDRTGWWSTGAVGVAIVASACCWLPLVFLALGASVVGVAGFFEKTRPYMIALSVVLLGVGFYVTYIRKPACTPGTACAVPSAAQRRWHRRGLWLATLAVVAFVLFPTYAGSVFGGAGDPVSAASTSDVQQVLSIEGMTCESCAAHVKRALVAVPGVLGVTVSYSERRAVVSMDASSPPSRDALAAALNEMGYDVGGSAEHMSVVPDTEQGG